MAAKPTCFVVQGFGEKTDLSNGRVLNLDASYGVIKEAVEEAGLKCVRADEVVHSGTIDRPAYEFLHRADLVIADLSAYSINAAYQLGIRYALRPKTTIVVAETQFRNPFDVSHMLIHWYEHLGREIGVNEARRFKGVLSLAIQQAMSGDQADSPVYALLSLNPPVDLRHPIEAPAAAAVAPVEATGSDRTREEQSAKYLLSRGRAAMQHVSFWAAKMYLKALYQLRPNDESVVQQLAAATYQARLPDPQSALSQARELLVRLQPTFSTNLETLQLWGKVHHRLWELTGNASQLDESIAAYQRAFFVKQHHLTANDLAYLLNARAALRTRAGDTVEAIADFAVARRMRRAALKLGEGALQADTTRAVEKYWLLACLWEAAVGVGDDASAARWRALAETSAGSGWRVNATRSKVARLEELLAVSPLATRPVAKSS